ncbi:MAG: NAD(P)H-dependent oxidoreductase [Alphaproteobacteria bacterium]|nr:NAD(P)H-dependent oxidoreductase [Alphaproteobacteria bacterium]
MSAKKFFISALVGTTLAATTVQAKTLVAYFTLTGNTQHAAEIIAQKAGADLYQIELITPYPSDYKEQIALAKKELSEGTLPLIKDLPANLDEYDIIFVGSPVWWGTIATPVRTFLASGALKGKTVIPFVTHGSGGPDKSFTDTKELCKDCKVRTDGWSGYNNLTPGLESWTQKMLEEVQK